MKRIVTAVALLATLVASPAFAQSAPNPHAASHQSGANVTDPDQVTIDGQNVGRDPDPNVREDLRREGPALLEGD
jgi:hypothetical protein